MCGVVVPYITFEINMKPSLVVTLYFPCALSGTGSSKDGVAIVLEQLLNFLKHCSYTE